MNDIVVRRKIFSVIAVLVAFCILYWTITTGNETYMLGGLGAMLLASLYLFKNC